MGFDSRIGPAFLDAGLGFGGSCFPKDVKALMAMAAEAGQHPQLLQAVMEINSYRRRWVVEQLTERLGSLEGTRIALLGVAFKPETDDIREAPSIELVHLLQSEGAEITAYDPAAAENAAAVTQDVRFAATPYEAVEGADAVVLVTEWNEFRHLDLARLKTLMRRPLLIDGRNLYDPEQLFNNGFEYVGVARGFLERSPDHVETEIILQD
jgi:UDPglucose 6-dehydrogenase